MDYDRFIAIVDQWAHVGTEAAGRITRATLETLAERLSASRARDLARELPPELLAPLSKVGGPEALDVDEFLGRVAEREGVDVTDAEQDARAVFAAVRRAAGDDVIAAVLAELPEDIAVLFRNIPVMPVEEFLAWVAACTGLDVDGARRATEAVLETLAERIAPGDVDDLISRLPVPLHGALKRGKARNQGAARKMPADAFLERVAEREGTDLDQAREHTRAVLATLRDAVEDEFYDVAVQLPDDYAGLAHPARG